MNVEGIEPRTDRTLKFLDIVYPEGPWALTAISVDKKKIETRTFVPDQATQLQKWLDKYNGERNLYWHVNPPTRAITKKAEREDIKEVAYLHVDIDPRAGEDLEEELERANSLLSRRRPKTVPRPTIIIFSGGGLQAFWKLKEPIPINGDLGRAEDAKRYNMQLETLFSADNCHNIDRLMRLPGTINIPDARKKKKGRVPKLAEMLENNHKCVYDISEFDQHQQVQMPGDSGFATGEGVDVNPNAERLDSVEDLNEWNVSDRVKVIIVQGRDPDNPKLDNSRSSWVFDACCQLVRAGVPDQVIFNVITDPGFGISESILDKGSNAIKYAKRQIERAKEEAVDPNLRELNEKHAVIGNLGGKCRVVEEIYDPVLKRSRLTRQSFQDFSNRYMHRRVQVGLDKAGDPVMRPLGKWWLDHGMRRQFETLVFSPGHEVDHAYNLWKGFSCEAIPGNCSLFLEHIRVNICGEVEEYYQYLLGWMARAVQHPDSPGETAVVMRGKRGTGKSFFVKQFGALFGRHFLQVSNAKHLVGAFNAHLRDCCVIFGDEAFYAGDKQHEGTLKTLITEEMMTIEGKGIDAEVGPNFTHMILASNSQWVVPAGADERRFFVLDVGDGAHQNMKYFKKLKAQMDSGGREALLHMLMNHDLTDYEVRQAPKTEALREQKLLSLGPEEEWWYRKLIDGHILERDDSWKTLVPKGAVLSDYCSYMQKVQVVTRRSNETTLGRFLTRVCPTLGRKQLRVDHEDYTEDGRTTKSEKRIYHYEFPSLGNCRKKWVQLYGEEEWPDGIIHEVEEEPNEEVEPF